MSAPSGNVMAALMMMGVQIVFALFFRPAAGWSEAVAATNAATLLRANALNSRLAPVRFAP